MTKTSKTIFWGKLKENIVSSLTFHFDQDDLSPRPRCPRRKRSERFWTLSDSLECIFSVPIDSQFMNSSTVEWLSLEFRLLKIRAIILYHCSVSMFRCLKGTPFSRPVLVKTLSPSFRRFTSVQNDKIAFPESLSSKENTVSVPERSAFIFKFAITKNSSCCCRRAATSLTTLSGAEILGIASVNRNSVKPSCNSR